MIAKTVLPEYKALVDNIPNRKDILIVWHGMDGFCLDFHGLEIAATYLQETKPKNNIFICVREYSGKLYIKGDGKGFHRPKSICFDFLTQARSQTIYPGAIHFFIQCFGSIRSIERRDL